MYKWTCVNNCNKHDWGTIWYMDYCEILTKELTRVIKSLYEHHNKSGVDHTIDFKSIIKDAEVMQDFLKRERTNIMILAASLIDQHDEWIVEKDDNVFK